MLESGLSNPMSDDFDAHIRNLDNDRWLASRFVADEQARADLMVLYAYDHELARAPVVASNPLMGEIRLTWWREALDEIFAGRPARQHPVVLALAELIHRRALPREPLEAMIDGRYPLLDKRPLTPDEALAYADGAGGGSMRAAALILDPASPPEATRAAGRAFGLARLGQAELADAVRASLAEARSAARALSVAAFPAVLPATLAGSRRGDLARRLRLFLASLTGRL